MASTYSDLKIELIATGEQSGTWGTTTNINLGTALEEAIVASADVSFAGADVTVTLTDSNATQTARHLRLNCTGTTGGARNLILGSGCQIQKPYLINNTCADTITVKNTTGTGIAVPAGKSMWVYNNGTNVVDAVTHLSSLTLGAALPVASGGTGLTSGTSGGVLAFTASGTLASSGALAANNLVIGGGAGVAPSTTTTGSGILTFLGTPSSANLAAAVTDETGTGALVFANSPSLTTPSLGAATATSVNKLTITAPATGATLTVADGATLATSGAYASTLTFTGATNVTFPTSGTLATTGGSVASINFGTTGLTPNTATTGAVTVAGTLAVANGGTGITSFGTGVATWLGTPSSANLAAAVTDETGTGSLVFATSPTLTTPNLGTPSAATLTNATGLPLSTGITGTLGIANGGTGLTTLTANNVILGNGTSTPSFVAPGSNGNVLTSNGTTWTSAAISGFVTPSADNAFTGANTFYNATGQTFAPASTNDGIIIQGRAGGSSSYRATFTTPTLGGNITLTTPSQTATLGYLNIPQSGSAKTTAYTLTTGDIGEFIEVGSGGSIEIPNSTFSAGDAVLVFNNTAAGITITCTITTAYIGGTDSDKATMTLATRGIASILFVSGTVCVVTGNVS